MSVGVVGRDGLVPGALRETASEVAGAVAFFDQRGCVSPQVVYVEEGGDVDPREFARELAAAMETVESNLPGGEMDAGEAANLQQVRGTAEVLAVSGIGVEVHHGGPRSWTVVLDPASQLAVHCVGRVVRVVPVEDLTAVPERLAPLSRHLQSVGVTGCGDRVLGLAGALAEAGATRIADMAQMPFPPPWWHHDGRGPLGVLVDRVDFERGE